MFTPLLAEFTAWHYLYTAWLSGLSIFLILVILVQRGRGGGLTGALGGMGGQSAFGTKAGDLFTKITIVVALLWGLSAMGIIRFVGGQSKTGGLSGQKSSSTTPAITTDKSKTDKTKSDDKKAGTSVEKGAETKTTPSKTPDTKTADTKTPAKTNADGEETTPEKTATDK